MFMCNLVAKSFGQAFHIEVIVQKAGASVTN